MDELRWNKISSCLILMFQIAAVSGNEISILKRVGDDVILPFLNAIDGENNCDKTTWTFASNDKSAAKLIGLSKSERLSMTANCSLVIKKLTAEDVGHYCCKKNTKFQHFDLRVITMTEYKDGDQVMLKCSVLTNEACHHTVRWLFNGQTVDKSDNQMVTSEPECSATFLESHLLYSSEDDLVTCEVTDTKTRSMQQFPFRPQFSAGETVSSSLRSAFVFVGLTALLTAVVTVNIWARAKENKTQTVKTTVSYNKERDEVATHIETTGGATVSVRLH